MATKEQAQARPMQRKWRLPTTTLLLKSDRPCRTGKTEQKLKNQQIHIMDRKNHLNATKNENEFINYDLNL